MLWEYRQIKCTAVIALWLLFAFWATLASAAQDDEWVYSLKKGDNVWNIAARFLLHQDYWRDLVKLNNIREPAKMKPGSRIRIPLYWLKVEPADIRVVNINGEADLIGVNGTHQALSASMRLHKGDRVRVGEGSSVLLEFADGTRQVLSSNTEIELVRVNRFGDSGLADTTVRVVQGRAENTVPTKGTRFQINTPSANTSVRGTRFRISVPEDQPVLSRVEVVGGNVHVAGDKGKTELPAGYGTLVEKGKAPSKAVKLLPAPKINDTLSEARYLPLKVAWEPVAGAKAYRVQIAQSNGEAAPVMVATVDDSHLTISDLPNGNYRLRVRGIDPMGLEGNEGLIDFNLANLEIQVIMNGQSLQLRWPQGTEGQRYQLQIAGDPSFSDVLFDTRLDVPHWQAQRPKNRVYFRVRILDGAKTPGGWSKPAAAGGG